MPPSLTDELSSNPKINMVEGEVTEGASLLILNVNLFLNPKPVTIWWLAWVTNFTVCPLLMQRSVLGTKGATWS